MTASQHYTSFRAPRAWKRAAEEPEVLVLSTSMLIDRILLHSTFLGTARAAARVRIWPASATVSENRGLWDGVDAIVEPFPDVEPFKEFPYNHARRLNDFVWDYRLRQPSRRSMEVHVRRKTRRLDLRALKVPARLLALAHAEKVLEAGVERLLLTYDRSPEALERLEWRRPAAVLTTGPFQFEQPAVVAAAKRLGIPTIALVPSWDNVSTKNRLVFRYDAYIVWSSQTKLELLEAYPAARHVPVYVVGAPQFDCFFDARYQQTREEFCATQGLDPSRPIVVYALGSPNLIREHFGALEMAERVERGELGDVQLLVRPHPLHDPGTLAPVEGLFTDRVRIQHPRAARLPLATRSQRRDEVVEWVNTFRHADVVVNLSSTVTVDAALFDRPVVNLDYDPEPGRPNQALIHDINHRWTHFRPIAESGGVWLTRDPRETVDAVRAYLARPDLHGEPRRHIAELVCEYADGRSGERLALALLDFVGRRAAAGGDQP